MVQAHENLAASGVKVRQWLGSGYDWVVGRRGVFGEISWDRENSVVKKAL